MQHAKISLFSLRWNFELLYYLKRRCLELPYCSCFKATPIQSYVFRKSLYREKGRQLKVEILHFYFKRILKIIFEILFDFQNNVC